MLFQIEILHLGICFGYFKLFPLCQLACTSEFTESYNMKSSTNLHERILLTYLK